MGVDLNIYNAITAIFETAYEDETVFPNVGHDGSKPQLRLSFLPAPTEPHGVSSGDIYEGFVQVDVVIDEGVGAQQGLVLAETVLGMFPRNHHIVESDTKIQFIKKGWLSANVQDETGYFIPVTIPYLVIY